MLGGVPQPDMVRGEPTAPRACRDLRRGPLSGPHRHAPQVRATLRSFANYLVHAAGFGNIAEANRQMARNETHPVKLYRPDFDGALATRQVQNRG
nr:hypothetical protein GCM10025730_16610 [Promicromonospora thailandica]